MTQEEDINIEIVVRCRGSGSSPIPAANSSELLQKGRAVSLRAFQMRLLYTDEREKKEGMVEINKRERGKIMADKKVSEEMDFKVKETQANLMALNDE